MASNGSFNTNAYEVRYLTFEWSVASQNVTTNQTTINWSLRGNGSNPTTWYMSGNFKVVIEGSTVYQSTTRIQLSGSTSVASGQFTLAHNADGNKSFSASVEAGIYYFAVNSRGSGTWSLPTIARATQPSVNKTTMAFGDSIIIYTPRASTVFTHTIQAGVDNKLNFTNIATNVATSHTWTLPKTWGRYLTHSTDKLKFRVLTYSGGQLIGSRDTNPVTVTATSDMAPVVNIALSDANNLYNTYGGFVKGKSKIRAVVSETMYEQAVVTTRSLVLNGITYQSNNQTSEVITSTTQKIEARVVDSRGMTGTKVLTPLVYDWYEPKITMAKANRCQANGTFDEAGTHIKLEYACAIAPVNNRNQKNLSYSYKPQNQSQATTQSITMDTYSKTGSVIFPASGESSWEVTLTLRDAFNSSQVVISVGTAFVLLDFHSSGKGIGVGKVSELQNTLDISPNWNLKYKNSIMTDFVIEQGIRNNWIYRKWYSGFLECYISGTIETVNQNAYRSKQFALPFNQPNTNYIVQVVPTLSGHYADYIWVGNTNGTNSKTTSSFTICIWSDNQNNFTFGVDIAVMGRWKN
ncbi:TPA: hypothetical protein TXT63_000751 [Streptococcus suis]|nr:hypothetical protein [Streptococcus suis]HEL1599841.1 hypothetical protein [Streptococcus suis]HEL1761106.1 hypothetical protein [Streptococcus suis]HEM6179018.1 hypothetical protein [Streptococcus suis]HEM6356449.1 hypothetical protein [Streptococcus suis]